MRVVVLTTSYPRTREDIAGLFGDEIAELELDWDKFIGQQPEALRLLADEALREGRQVTVLLGAQSARDVYPSTLLPDEVEYVVATVDGSLGHPGSVADLVPQYEAWADQTFAAGSPALLYRPTDPSARVATAERATR